MTTMKCSYFQDYFSSFHLISFCCTVIWDKAWAWMELNLKFLSTYWLTIFLMLWVLWWNHGHYNDNSHSSSLFMQLSIMVAMTRLPQQYHLVYFPLYYCKHLMISVTDSFKLLVSFSNKFHSVIRHTLI